MNLQRAIRSLSVGLFLCFVLTTEGRATDPLLRDGWLLVASPSLSDPNFHHAVILLAHHDNDGGFGFILNRPFGSGPLGILLDGLGVETSPDALADKPVDLFLGGPVQMGLGFVVHTPDHKGPDTRPIGDLPLAFSTDAALLGAIAEGRGPGRHRVFLGYTGWAPGQLETELDRGDWQLAPARGDDVFTATPYSLWKALQARIVTPL